MDKFTVQTIKGTVNPKVLAALKTLEAELGVKVSLRNGTFEDLKYTVKLEVVIVCDDPRKTPEAQQFLKFASLVNLKPEDLFRKFLFQGEEYEIVGLNLKARKNPIMLKNIETSKIFTAPQDMVYEELLKQK